MERKNHVKACLQRVRFLQLLLVLFVLILPASVAAQRRNTTPRPLPTTVPADLDRFVAQVLEKFEVPGVSIAIVKDGKAILTKGYGTKILGEAKPVDEHTLFGIASNSKAFTATLLAILVEEGVFAWNDRVVDYLPWFKMSDPYVTQHLTIQDLMVHNSGLGLGAGDLLQFPPTTYTAREISEKLRYLPLTASFRERYAYDNVLYVVAGVLVEEVTGKSWEQLVEEKIFKKIGMDSSLSRISDLMSQANIAYPHTRVDGKITKGENFPDIRIADVSNAAGGISSNAVDMAKWLQLQLDSGRWNNGRLFSPATAQRLWTIVTPMPIAKPTQLLPHLKMSYFGYALGFRVHNYRDYQMVTHTGGLSGAFYSRVTLIPELDLGIAVLTNQGSRDAFEALTHHLVDHFISAPPFDWLEAHYQTEKQREERVRLIDENANTDRNLNSHPSLPLEQYVGTYRDAWYGDIEVGLDQGKLTMKIKHSPVLTGTLEHWQYDSFVARWYDRSMKSDAFVTFILGPEGKIEEIKMKAASPSVDFSRDFHDLKLFPVQKK